MSYVGNMSDLIELYLAELERDGICYLTVTNELNGSCAISTAQAKELLTDFAQWLEDDVQDDETVDGLSADITLVDDAAELNLTGLGLRIEEGFKPVEIAVIQAKNIIKPIGKSDFAAQIARLIQEKDIKLRFGTCKDIEEDDVE